MGWMGPIANLLNPGDAQRVRDTDQAITDTLTPGSSYWQSGDLGLGTAGTQGNALLNQATQIGANNVSANFTPMDQDTAALGSLGSTFANQFLHGGKAEAAAKARAVSSMADVGGGGLGGVERLTQGSQQLSKQAEQTALTERANSASQANSDNLMAGMMQIRKAALQAAVTHANLQKNIASQQLLNSLQNTQTGLDQQLQGGANQAQYAQQMGEIQNNVSQNQLGMGLLSAGAQGAATALGLGSQMSTTTVDPMATVSESEIQNAANNTLAQYGINPSSLPATPALTTGQEAAQVTQDQLNGLLGTSSKIAYPTLQSDASQYLTSAAAYPATSSVV